MKKHMGKRILAIALAAAMMSSVVDYSCVMEVHAEESSNESVNTDEAAEVTEESNETAEITEDTGDVAETVAEEEAVTTEENETATEEDAENGVTEPEVTVEPEKTDAASEPDDVETKPAAEPTEETTVVESQKAIPAVSSEVILSEAMQTENSQAEVSTEDTGETSDQKDAEKETEEQTLTVEETAEIDPEILEQLPDNDELFAGHVEQVLYGNEDVSTYADYGKSKFTGINRSIYEELRTFVKNIADNGGNAVYTWKGDLGITWSSDKEGTELENEVSQKFNENIQINEIISTILVDCPYEMYWYDKTKSANIRYGYYSKNGSVKITNLELLCTPVAAYKGTDANEVDSSKASAASTAAENAQTIVAENASKSDHEKLDAYREKICELVSYNDAAAKDGYVNTHGYGDPWQLIYVFDGKPDTNVVCEGYSKAFQYLCDLSEFKNHTINCYTVTGEMNDDGHMWNIVRMEDDKNYLVDVTNCDTTTNGITAGYPDKLFLAGVSGTVSDGYLASFTNDYGSSSRITYVYDTNTKSLYSTDILTLSSANYAVSTVTKNIIDSMVTLSADSKEYDGNTTEPTSLITVKYEDTILKNDTDYTVTIKKDGISVDQIKNAGTYEITVTGKGAYRGTVTKRYVVEKKKLIPSVNGMISKVYDGTKDVKKDDFTIQLDGIVTGEQVIAIAGSAAYESPNAASNIKVNITEITLAGDTADNYELSSSNVLTTGIITEKIVSNPDISVFAADLCYNGKPIEPSLTVKDGDIKIPETEYISSFKNNINVGKMTVILTDNEGGNYQVSGSAEFEIRPQGFDGAKITINESYTYTGELITPDIDKWSVTFQDKILTEDDYEFDRYTDNINVGTAYAIFKGKGNYSGKSKGVFTIVPKDISSVTIESVSDQYYTGVAIEPELTVTDNGKKLTEDIDYTVSYSNNTEVGNAKAVITGVGNYCSTKGTSFRIVESEEPIQAVLQGTAAITGTAVYGGMLTPSAVISTSNTGVLTYTWYVNNEQKSVGNTFALKDASFIGKSIRVEVKASNCTGTLSAELSVDKNGSTTVQKGTSPAENKPQNGVVNDTKGVDTFTFTGKAGVSYEYSLDGGAAWKNVKLSGTTGTVSVGDVDLVAGMLKVRAKETNVYLAGDSIWNTTAFTVAKETPVTPTEPSEPTTPSQPTPPTEPTTPSQPTTPTEPSTPSQPITPTEPSAPTTPEQPSVPEQPSTPAIPTQPELPSEEPEVEPDTLNVTVGNIKVQSYTGKGITPKITVKDPATRKKLKQGKHYTVSYENNVNVGTAVIVIRGIEANGYSGVKHVYFTIQPQTVAKKMKASVAGKKFRYTGHELTPGVNLTYNKMKLTEGVDYVVSYSNNVEKGTAKIFITGIGNYTGSRTVKFKITGPKLKDAQVSLVENGTAYPDITVTYAGKTLAEGQDYTVKYPKVVKPGNNRIIVRGRGSFSGSVKLTYYVEGL